MNIKLSNLFQQILDLHVNQYRCKLHSQANVFCENQNYLQIYCEHCIYKQHKCKEMKIRYISQFITNTKMEMKDILQNLKKIQLIKYKSTFQNQCLHSQKICLKFSQQMKKNKSIYQQKYNEQKKNLRNFLNIFSQQLKNINLLEAGGKNQLYKKLQQIRNELNKYTNEIKKYQQQGNKSIKHQFDITIKKLKQLIIITQQVQNQSQKSAKMNLLGQISKKQQQIQKLQSELIQLRYINQKYKKLIEEKQKIIENISCQLSESSNKNKQLFNEKLYLKNQNQTLLKKCSESSKIQKQLSDYQIELNQNPIYKRILSQQITKQMHQRAKYDRLMNDLNFKDKKIKFLQLNLKKYEQSKQIQKLDQKFFDSEINYEKNEIKKIQLVESQLEKNKVELKEALQNLEKLKQDYEKLNKLYIENEEMLVSIYYKSSRKSSNSFDYIQNKSFSIIQKISEEMKEQKQKINSFQIEFPRNKQNVNILTSCKKQFHLLYENQIDNIKLENKRILKQNLRLQQQNKENIQIIEQNKEKLRITKRAQKIFTHLITQNQVLLILDYLESNKIQFHYSQIIFNAKIHKFSSDQFYKLCNNLSRLLIIIKTINENIIGGFIQSEYGKQQHQTTKSFIFNLNKQYFANIKQNQIASKTQVGWGPIFGDNQDLKIKQNKLYSNYYNNKSNYCKIKHNFSDQKFFLDGKDVLEIQNYLIFQLN